MSSIDITLKRHDDNYNTDLYYQYRRELEDTLRVIRDRYGVDYENEDSKQQYFAKCKRGEVSQDIQRSFDSDVGEYNRAKHRLCFSRLGIALIRQMNENNVETKAEVMKGAKNTRDFLEAIYMEQQCQHYDFSYADVEQQIDSIIRLRQVIDDVLHYINIE